MAPDGGIRKFSSEGRNNNNNNNQSPSPQSESDLFDAVFVKSKLKLSKPKSSKDQVQGPNKNNTLLRLKLPGILSIQRDHSNHDDHSEDKDNENNEDHNSYSKSNSGDDFRVMHDSFVIMDEIIPPNSSSSSSSVSSSRIGSRVVSSSSELLSSSGFRFPIQEIKDDSEEDDDENLDDYTYYSTYNDTFTKIVPNSQSRSLQQQQQQATPQMSEPLVLPRQRRHKPPTILAPAIRSSSSSSSGPQESGYIHHNQRIVQTPEVLKPQILKPQLLNPQAPIPQPLTTTSPQTPVIKIEKEIPTSLPRTPRLDTGVGWATPRGILKRFKRDLTPQETFEKPEETPTPEETKGDLVNSAPTPKMKNSAPTMAPTIAPATTNLAPPVPAPTTLRTRLLKRKPITNVPNSTISWDPTIPSKAEEKIECMNPATPKQQQKKQPQPQKRKPLPSPPEMPQIEGYLGISWNTMFGDPTAAPKSAELLDTVPVSNEDESIVPTSTMINNGFWHKLRENMFISGEDPSLDNSEMTTPGAVTVAATTAPTTTVREDMGDEEYYYSPTQKRFQKTIRFLFQKQNKTPSNSNLVETTSDEGEFERDNNNLPQSESVGPSTMLARGTTLAFNSIRQLTRSTVVLRPVDNLIERRQMTIMATSPTAATPNRDYLTSGIVILELVILVWVLYEISIVIETLAIMVKVGCMPVIICCKVILWMLGWRQ